MGFLFGLLTGMFAFVATLAIVVVHALKINLDLPDANIKKINNGTSQESASVRTSGYDFSDIPENRLRQMIRQIIAETMTLPPLINGPSISEIALDTSPRAMGNNPLTNNDFDQSHRTEHYFEPTIYQNLLATAVLNKIVDKRLKSNQNASEKNTVDGDDDLNDNVSLAIRDRNFNFENSSTSSGSSVEPRSDCSYPEVEGILYNNDEKSSELLRNSDRDSVMSDYLANHMIPLPDLNAAVAESEEDDYTSVTSSAVGEGTWEKNWFLKKKRSSLNPSVTSSSIGMLVPDPKEDIRAQIGDKTADEVSDLSELGSDSDDSLNSLNSQLEPINDRLINKHLIGGQNSKIILDELIERSSTIANTFPNDAKPLYTDARNEYMISSKSRNEAINDKVNQQQTVTEQKDELVVPEGVNSISLAASSDNSKSDGCTGFSAVEVFESSSIPSVVEILAAMALSPMLAFPSIDQSVTMTVSDHNAFTDLKELALAEIRSRGLELTPRNLDVIPEESRDIINQTGNVLKKSSDEIDFHYLQFPSLMETDECKTEKNIAASEASSSLFVSEQQYPQNDSPVSLISFNETKEKSLDQTIVTPNVHTTLAEETTSNEAIEKSKYVSTNCLSDKSNISIEQNTHVMSEHNTKNSNEKKTQKIIQEYSDKNIATAYNVNACVDEHIKELSEAGTCSNADQLNMPADIIPQGELLESQIKGIKRESTEQSDFMKSVADEPSKAEVNSKENDLKEIPGSILEEDQSAITKLNCSIERNTDVMSEHDITTPSEQLTQTFLQEISDTNITTAHNVYASADEATTDQLNMEAEITTKAQLLEPQPEVDSKVNDLKYVAANIAEEDLSILKNHLQPDLHIATISAERVLTADTEPPELPANERSHLSSIAINDTKEEVNLSKEFAKAVADSKTEERNQEIAGTVLEEDQLILIKSNISTEGNTHVLSEHYIKNSNEQPIQTLLQEISDANITTDHNVCACADEAETSSTRDQLNMEPETNTKEQILEPKTEEIKTNSGEQSQSKNAPDDSLKAEVDSKENDLKDVAVTVPEEDLSILNNHLYPDLHIGTISAASILKTETKQPEILSNERSHLLSIGNNETKEEMNLSKKFVEIIADSETEEGNDEIEATISDSNSIIVGNTHVMSTNDATNSNEQPTQTLLQEISDTNLTTAHNVYGSADDSETFPPTDQLNMKAEVITKEQLLEPQAEVDSKENNLKVAVSIAEEDLSILKNDLHPDLQVGTISAERVLRKVTKQPELPVNEPSHLSSISNNKTKEEMNLSKEFVEIVADSKQGEGNQEIAGTVLEEDPSILIKSNASAEENTHLMSEHIIQTSNEQPTKILLHEISDTNIITAHNVYACADEAETSSTTDQLNMEAEINTKEQLELTVNEQPHLSSISNNKTKEEMNLSKEFGEIVADSKQGEGNQEIAGTVLEEDPSILIKSNVSTEENTHLMSKHIIQTSKEQPTQILLQEISDTNIITAHNVYACADEAETSSTTDQLNMETEINTKEQLLERKIEEINTDSAEQSESKHLADESPKADVDSEENDLKDVAVTVPEEDLSILNNYLLPDLHVGSFSAESVLKTETKQLKLLSIERSQLLSIANNETKEQVNLSKEFVEIVADSKTEERNEEIAANISGEDPSILIQSNTTIEGNSHAMSANDTTNSNEQPTQTLLPEISDTNLNTAHNIYGSADDAETFPPTDQLNMEAEVITKEPLLEPQAEVDSKENNLKDVAANIAEQDLSILKNDLQSDFHGVTISAEIVLGTKTKQPELPANERSHLSRIANNEPQKEESLPKEFVVIVVHSKTEERNQEIAGIILEEDPWILIKSNVSTEETTHVMSEHNIKNSNEQPTQIFQPEISDTNITTAHSVYASAEDAETSLTTDILDMEAEIYTKEPLLESQIEEIKTDSGEQSESKHLADESPKAEVDSEENDLKDVGVTVPEEDLSILNNYLHPDLHVGSFSAESILKTETKQLALLSNERSQLLSIANNETKEEVNLSKEFVEIVADSKTEEGDQEIAETISEENPSILFQSNSTIEGNTHVMSENDITNLNEQPTQTLLQEISDTNLTTAHNVYRSADDTETFPTTDQLNMEAEVITTEQLLEPQPEVDSKENNLKVAVSIAEEDLSILRNDLQSDLRGATISAEIFLRTNTKQPELPPNKRSHLSRIANNETKVEESLSKEFVEIVVHSKTKERNQEVAGIVLENPSILIKSNSSTVENTHVMSEHNIKKSNKHPTQTLLQEISDTNITTAHNVYASADDAEISPTRDQLNMESENISKEHLLETQMKGIDAGSGEQSQAKNSAIEPLTAEAGSKNNDLKDVAVTIPKEDLSSLKNDREPDIYVATILPERVLRTETEQPELLCNECFHLSTIANIKTKEEVYLSKELAAIVSGSKNEGGTQETEGNISQEGPSILINSNSSIDGNTNVISEDGITNSNGHPTQPLLQEISNTNITTVHNVYVAADDTETSLTTDILDMEVEIYTKEPLLESQIEEIKTDSGEQSESKQLSDVSPKAEVDSKENDMKDGDVTVPEEDLSILKNHLQPNLHVVTNTAERVLRTENKQPELLSNECSHLSSIANNVTKEEVNSSKELAEIVSDSKTEEGNEEIAANISEEDPSILIQSNPTVEGNTHVMSESDITNSHKQPTQTLLQEISVTNLTTAHNVCGYADDAEMFPTTGQLNMEAEVITKEQLLEPQAEVDSKENNLKVAVSIAEEDHTNLKNDLHPDLQVGTISAERVLRKVTKQPELPFTEQSHLYSVSNNKTKEEMNLSKEFVEIVADSKQGEGNQEIAGTVLEEDPSILIKSNVSTEENKHVMSEHNVQTSNEQSTQIFLQEISDTNIITAHNVYAWADEAETSSTTDQLNMEVEINTKEQLLERQIEEIKTDSAEQSESKHLADESPKADVDSEENDLKDVAVTVPEEDLSILNHHLHPDLHVGSFSAESVLKTETKQLELLSNERSQLWSIANNETKEQLILSKEFVEIVASSKTEERNEEIAANISGEDPSILIQSNATIEGNSHALSENGITNSNEQPTQTLLQEISDTNLTTAYNVYGSADDAETLSTTVQLNMEAEVITTEQLLEPQAEDDSKENDLKDVAANIAEQDLSILKNDLQSDLHGVTISAERVLGTKTKQPELPANEHSHLSNISNNKVKEEMNLSKDFVEIVADSKKEEGNQEIAGTVFEEDPSILTQSNSDTEENTHVVSEQNIKTSNEQPTQTLQQEILKTETKQPELLSNELSHLSSILNNETKEEVNLSKEFLEIVAHLKTEERNPEMAGTVWEEDPSILIKSNSRTGENTHVVSEQNIKNSNEQPTQIILQEKSDTNITTAFNAYASADDAETSPTRDKLNLEPEIISKEPEIFETRIEGFNADSEEQPQSQNSAGEPLKAEADSKKNDLKDVAVSIPEEDLSRLNNYREPDIYVATSLPERILHSKTKQTELLSNEHSHLSNTGDNEKAKEEVNVTNELSKELDSKTEESSIVVIDHFGTKDNVGKDTLKTEADLKEEQPKMHVEINNKEQYSETQTRKTELVSNGPSESTDESEIPREFLEAVCEKQSLNLRNEEYEGFSTNHTKGMSNIGKEESKSEVDSRNNQSNSHVDILSTERDSQTQSKNTSNEDSICPIAAADEPSKKDVCSLEEVSNELIGTISENKLLDSNTQESGIIPFKKLDPTNGVAKDTLKINVEILVELTSTEKKSETVSRQAGLVPDEHSLSTSIPTNKPPEVREFAEIISEDLSTTNNIKKNVSKAEMNSKLDQSNLYIETFSSRGAHSSEEIPNVFAATTSEKQFLSSNTEGSGGFILEQLDNDVENFKTIEDSANKQADTCSNNSVNMKDTEDYVLKTEDAQSKSTENHSQTQTKQTESERLAVEHSEAMNNVKVKGELHSDTGISQREFVSNEHYEHSNISTDESGKPVLNSVDEVAEESGETNSNEKLLELTAEECKEISTNYSATMNDTLQLQTQQSLLASKEHPDSSNTSVSEPFEAKVEVEEISPNAEVNSLKKIEENAAQTVCPESSVDLITVESERISISHNGTMSIGNKASKLELDSQGQQSKLPADDIPVEIFLQGQTKTDEKSDAVEKTSKIVAATDKILNMYSEIISEEHRRSNSLITSSERISNESAGTISVEWPLIHTTEESFISTSEVDSLQKIEEYFAETISVEPSSLITEKSEGFSIGHLDSMRNIEKEASKTEVYSKVEHVSLNAELISEAQTELVSKKYADPLNATTNELANAEINSSGSSSSSDQELSFSNAGTAGGISLNDSVVEALKMESDLNDVANMPVEINSKQKTSRTQTKQTELVFTECLDSVDSVTREPSKAEVDSTGKISKQSATTISENFKTEESEIIYIAHSDLIQSITEGTSEAKLDTKDKQSKCAEIYFEAQLPGGQSKIVLSENLESSSAQINMAPGAEVDLLNEIAKELPEKQPLDTNTEKCRRIVSCDSESTTDFGKQTVGFISQQQVSEQLTDRSEILADADSYPSNCATIELPEEMTKLLTEKMPHENHLVIETEQTKRNCTEYKNISNNESKEPSKSEEDLLKSYSAMCDETNWSQQYLQTPVAEEVPLEGEYPGSSTDIHQKAAKRSSEASRELSNGLQLNDSLSKEADVIRAEPSETQTTSSEVISKEIERCSKKELSNKNLNNNTNSSSSVDIEQQEFADNFLLSKSDFDEIISEKSFSTLQSDQIGTKTEPSQIPEEYSIEFSICDAIASDTSCNLTNDNSYVNKLKPSKEINKGISEEHDSESLIPTNKIEETLLEKIPARQYELISNLQSIETQPRNIKVILGVCSDSTKNLNDEQCKLEECLLEKMPTTIDEIISNEQSYELIRTISQNQSCIKPNHENCEAQVDQTKLTFNDPSSKNYNIPDASNNVINSVSGVNQISLHKSDINLNKTKNNNLVELHGVSKQIPPRYLLTDSKVIESTTQVGVLKLHSVSDSKSSQPEVENLLQERGLSMYSLDIAEEQDSFEDNPTVTRQGTVVEKENTNFAEGILPSDQLSHDSNPYHGSRTSTVEEYFENGNDEENLLAKNFNNKSTTNTSLTANTNSSLATYSKENTNDTKNFNHKPYVVQILPPASNQLHPENVLTSAVEQIDVKIDKTRKDFNDTNINVGACNDDVGDNHDKDEEDDDILAIFRHFVPGSIAEREYKKWYNAVEMPNNPYTPEALRRRISGSKERLIDLPNISPTKDMNSLDLLNEPSLVAGENLKLENDYKRYSRDYYINSSLTAQEITQTRDVSDLKAKENREVTTSSTEAESENHVYKAIPAKVIEVSSSLIETSSAVSTEMQVMTSVSDDSDTIKICDFSKHNEAGIKKAEGVETLAEIDAEEATACSGIKRSESSGNGITPTRGSTPVAFKFLQPKRKLLEPNQILTIDEKGPEVASSPLQKPVIEAEVIKALPSVKALARAFLMTTNTTQPEKLWIRKAKTLSQSGTKYPTSPKRSLDVLSKPEPVKLEDDVTITSDLSSLETDSSSMGAEIASTSDLSAQDAPLTKDPSSPATRGILKGNIEFFENLKNK